MGSGASKEAPLAQVQRRSASLSSRLDPRQPPPAAELDRLCKQGLVVPCELDGPFATAAFHKNVSGNHRGYCDDASWKVDMARKWAAMQQQSSWDAVDTSVPDFSPEFACSTGTIGGRPLDLQQLRPRVESAQVELRAAYSGLLAAARTDDEGGEDAYQTLTKDPAFDAKRFREALLLRRVSELAEQARVVEEASLRAGDTDRCDGAPAASLATTPVQRAVAAAWTARQEGSRQREHRDATDMLSLYDGALRALPQLWALTVAAREASGQQDAPMEWSLKRPLRAWHKLGREYGGKVSRLTDVARSTILLRGLPELMRAAAFLLGHGQVSAAPHTRSCTHDRQHPQLPLSRPRSRALALWCAGD